MNKPTKPSRTPSPTFALGLVFVAAALAAIACAVIIAEAVGW